MENQDSEISKERKLSAKHIKSYRNDVLRMTQKEFAGLIGREQQAVARYEKGKTRIPGTVVDRLVHLSDWIKEYWEGLTECRTYEDFCIEGELAALDDIHLANDIQKRRETQINSAFNVFGFRYENYSIVTPAHDYVFISDNNAKHKIENGYCHKIAAKRTDSSTDSAFFSDDEMSKLLSDISDLIAFRCYQKSKNL